MRTKRGEIIHSGGVVHIVENRFIYYYDVGFESNFGLVACLAESDALQISKYRLMHDHE